MLLIQIIDKLFLVYTVMILIRILSSWVPEWQNTKPMLFVAYYTDPYLDLFRRFIPPLGMIDISPIIAVLCLGMIENLLKLLIASSAGWAR